MHYIKLPFGIGKKLLTEANADIDLQFIGWHPHDVDDNGKTFGYEAYAVGGVIQHEDAPEDTKNWWIKKAHMQQVIAPADPFAQQVDAALNNVKPPKPKEKVVAMQLLKVGADVEVFLVQPGVGPVPCVQLIGGTKEKPIPILEELGPGFALQEDNVMLEYNIPPASTSHEFVYNLRRINEEIVGRVGKMGLAPVIEASMRFRAEQLESDQAKVFGCDPDFNVWDRCPNEKPELTGEDKLLRTAGGHVHVSFNINGEPPKFPEHLSEIETIVMGMDILVGIPSVILDKDRERRKLYGKAGAFRRKPYGIEWRTSSNWWTQKPTYMAFVYQQVERLFTTIAYDGAAKTGERWRKSKPAVQHIINNCDTMEAARFCRQNEILLPA